MKNRVRQARNEASQQAVNMARGDLELAEGTLAEAGDLFARLQEIALSGGNGTLGADERKNLATEVGNIKQQLVSLANSRGSKGYLFAGNQVETTPFSSSGAFSGDDGDQVVDPRLGQPSRRRQRARAFTAAAGATCSRTSTRSRVPQRQRHAGATARSRAGGLAKQVMAARTAAASKFHA